jgi:hypothetical protein
MIVDTLFLLASAALGWGLSLATYRMFAARNGWSMGEVQADATWIAVLLGLFAVIASALFAAARGADYGGWAILVAGLAIALVWTGFLRVASQISLFLAPVAAVLLLLGWAQVRYPGSERELVPTKTYYEPRDRSGGPVIIDEKGRIETLPRGDGTARTVDPRVQPRAQ